MNKLINIKNENGKQLVSAKDLYLGLGLRKEHWNRWSIENIKNNGYFKIYEDWNGFTTMANGNETMDFIISIDFAKHIAMMARTEKSHEYRNYFLECENQVKGLQPKLSVELQSIIMLDQRTTETITRLNNLENTMPLFNTDCKDLQALVKKIGTKALGGYRTAAYKDNSLRGKVYADIQGQLKRQFGVGRYESIKRKQIDSAKEILEKYVLPIYLLDDVTLLNNQVEIPFGNLND